jgi:hypothetical protein
MANVKYWHTATPGGILTPVTHFSDTFNRASGGMGQNWIQTVGPWSPITNPVGSGTWAIGSCVDVVQGLICTYVGSANPGMWWNTTVICVPLILTCWGLSQFSEWKSVSLTDGGLLNVIGGPSVMTQNQGNQSVGNVNNGNTGYSFQRASDGSCSIRRGCSGTFTTLGTAVAGTAPDGSIMRIEAVVTPGVSTVLTAKVNGTIVLGPFTDAFANPMIIGGSPSLYMLQIDGTAAETMVNQWRNFNGGRL